MTTANTAQTFTEAIALNPAPAGIGAQALTEVIGFNPGNMMQGAQVFMEVICGQGFPVLTWNGKRIDGTRVG